MSAAERVSFPVKAVIVLIFIGLLCGCSEDQDDNPITLETLAFVRVKNSPASLGRMVDVHFSNDEAIYNHVSLDPGDSTDYEPKSGSSYSMVMADFFIGNSQLQILYSLNRLGPIERLHFYTILVTFDSTSYSQELIEDELF